jgi:glycosyltransferase involved in cell wall biosynthesis
VDLTARAEAFRAATVRDATVGPHTEPVPAVAWPDVTVCVATFGDTSWCRTAEQVALPSARATGAQVVYAHADTLWNARNAALDHVDTTWVVYLDADDELEDGYLNAMDAATGDVRVPRVRYVTDPARLPKPVMPRVAGHRHVCTPACLPCGNWIVIGAQASTQLLRDVGGWRAYGWEDWDLWLRCHLAGAHIQPVPAAIYRAHVHPGSRGRYTQEESLRHHLEVAAANGFDLHGHPLPSDVRTRP